MADYDVAIVGAGPTGLAAAVYTGREELSTIVLDKGVIGGLIATTEHVDNYPGFPEGIGGLDLADAMMKHATRFGAKIKTGVTVSSIMKHKADFELETSTGPITARTVLIATGSNYKKLDMPGEKAMEGKGVHYCATCDGPLYRKKHVIAVGGGNSVLQEGLFLTKFVDKLTVLVRGDAFKGSDILAEALRQKSNVEVLFNTSVTEILAENGRFAGVKVASPHLDHISADGLFAFIGLIPNSQWLPPEVAVDERGFVKVNRLVTTVPGIFAAGDIIEGSVGQVASAVGEGVSAALAIRAYLDPHHATASYIAPVESALL